MAEVILDALIDTLKTIPFLFIAYLLLEYFEHKANERFTLMLSKAGPWGPIGGAVLGLIPQCGFSAAAANFYSGGLITAGTLIAVFLSTSDEAAPILLSHPEALPVLIRLLLIKALSAVFFGCCVDLALHRFVRPKQKPRLHAHCHHCGCGENGIFLAALRHTCTIALLATIIGLIPNCASSVILTELYLSNALSFGSAVAGLCMGAGIGLVVLFRTNKNLRQNLCLTGALFLFSAITGMACDFLLPF